MRKFLALVGVCAVLLIVLGIAVSVSKSRNTLKLSSAQHVITEKMVREKSAACRLSGTPSETGVFGLSTPYLNEELFGYLADLKVKWIRMDINWSLVGSTEGVYDWSYYDELISYTHKNHSKILGTVNFIPPRISDWSEFEREYKTFLKGVVERYKPGGTFAREKDWGNYGISYWEIFNEPNLLGVGWMTWGGDAFQYLPEYGYVLSISNPIIRAEDPSAHILLGGLSSVPNSYDYFSKLTALGISNCYDIIAYHPYDKIGSFADVKASLMKIERGTPTKPLWFNEFGINRKDGQEAALTKALEEKNIVDGFFWYTLYEPQGSSVMGILGKGYEKMPTYDIIKRFLSQ